MGNNKYETTIDMFLTYVKQNYPDYNIENEGGRVYFVKGDKDCIEFSKSDYTLTPYKHSSKECKDECEEMETELFLRVRQL